MLDFISTVLNSLNRILSDKTSFLFELIEQPVILWLISEFICFVLFKKADENR